jgi:RNA polymerase sigma-70 factor (ECF subfamily)
MTSLAATLDEVNSPWESLPEKQATEAARPDYQLAQRIARGDMEAFEELYTRYHRHVYGLCLRMTNNVTEAEDLTQDIFIHVYHKIGGFRGESTMGTWLHRVTINNVLMHFRKNSVRRERTTEDGETPEPAVKLRRSQREAPILDRLALERAIGQLSPGYRAVLILHDVEGYEHHEIASICGNSIGTSKSQLHKARNRLYELLHGRSRVKDSRRN